ncbi:hypothetical protein FJ366_00030 [Candidatus Dependentiae bacterium]|nr:hypothetical protein [Candidatus Dependentiae bacterium]
MNLSKHLFTLILVITSPCFLHPQKNFSGVYSLEVTHKKLTKLPETPDHYTLSSATLFDHFSAPQPSQSLVKIDPEIEKCSQFFIKECKNLLLARQVRRSIIASATLNLPDEKTTLGIKLVLRKADTQLFAAITILSTGSVDKKVLTAVANMCKSLIPQLSFMQKHWGKTLTGGIATIGIASAIISRSKTYQKWYRRKYLITFKKTSTSEDSSNKCPVCQMEFEENEEQWSTKGCTCKNSYCHKECILQAVLSQEDNVWEVQTTDGTARIPKPIDNPRCPVCRN